MSAVATSAVVDRPAPAPSRSGFASRPPGPTRPSRPAAAGGRGGKASPRTPGRAGGSGERKEDEILFQKFFKSVGPRTYAAQVKRARNGNHYLVLTEGKRDAESGDVRKIRLYVYGEDFVEFFRLIKSAAEFIRDNPVPDDVKRKREQFWARQREQGHHGGASPLASPKAPRPRVRASQGPSRPLGQGTDLQRGRT